MCWLMLEDFDRMEAIRAWQAIMTKDRTRIQFPHGFSPGSLNLVEIRIKGQTNLC